MKGFVKEFKEFIDRGNVMDLAVAVVIGGAFTAIVNALTANIITPLIAFVTGGNGTTPGGLVVPGTEIDFGAFIGACINFLIVALVVFLLVKALNKAKSLGKKTEEEALAEEPPTCPYCLEEVKPGATRCPHCGSVVADATTE